MRRAESGSEGSLIPVLVKRVLRKDGYPPDKQAKATETVLEQAEVLSEMWARVNDWRARVVNPVDVQSFGADSESRYADRA